MWLNVELQEKPQGGPCSLFSLMAHFSLEFQSAGSPGMARWPCMWGGRDMGLSRENRSVIVACLMPVWLGESASSMTAYTVTEAFQRPSAAGSQSVRSWAFLLFSFKRSLGSLGNCKSATVPHAPAVFPSLPSTHSGLGGDLGRPWSSSCHSSPGSWASGC